MANRFSGDEAFDFDSRFDRDVEREPAHQRPPRRITTLEMEAARVHRRNAGQQHHADGAAPDHPHYDTREERDDFESANDRLYRGDR